MKQILTYFIFLISISMFSQSPWTQEKGKYYTQLSFTTIPSYNELFGKPDIRTNGNITDNTIQLYTEYGLSNNTTFLVNIPLKLISVKNYAYTDPAIDCVGDCSEKLNGSKTAFGNIEIGLKHNFYKKNWLVSAQFSVETNTSTSNDKFQIRTGYNAWTFTSIFTAGKSFKKTYLQTFIGYKIRTNKYNSNFKMGGEFGRKISKNIWLIGFMDIEISFKKDDQNLSILNGSTGLYVNNQEYSVVGIKAIGEISNNFGMTASLPAAFFGNNVAKQVALSIGVYKKF